MKTSERLAQARDHVAKGWTKHEFQDPDGNVCALGALYRSFDWLPETHNPCHSPEFLAEPRTREWPRPPGAIQWVQAVAALRAKIKEIAPKVNCPDLEAWVVVVTYNDRDQTTLQDMINVFDKAIIGLEEQGK